MYKLIRRNKVIYRSRRYVVIADYVRKHYNCTIQFLVNHKHFTLSYEDR